jgi:hypothetical protein
MTLINHPEFQASCRIVALFSGRFDSRGVKRECALGAPCTIVLSSNEVRKQNEKNLAGKTRRERAGVLSVA